MRVKDNWEYVQDFCNDFGRLPKDADELEYFLSYVDEKRQKAGRDTTKMMETPVSDDLEKAAKEYVKDIPIFKDSCLMKAAFEDGWLCSKERMMKDAVETEVVSRVTNKGLLPAVTFLVDKSYKEGDKVKVLIVK